MPGSSALIVVKVYWSVNTNCKRRPDECDVM